MRKNLLSALVAASFAVAAGSASAADLIFDPTGAGGATGSYTVDRLDWAPNGVLAVDGNQAVANFLNGAADVGFQVLFHTSLTSGSLLGAGVFDASTADWEITMVLGFHETVVAASTGIPNITGGSATFAFDATQPTFVRIYYEATKNHDDLTGLGFNDGQLIFESSLTTVFGQFTNQFEPASDDFDQANDDDWNGLQTVTGAGSQSTLFLEVASPTFIDSDFFKNPPLLQFLIENVSLNVPFTTTDPSYAYTKDDNTLYNVTTDAGVTSTLGNLNGGLDCTSGRCIAAGPDFMFQTDVNSAVQASIPEPGTLALLGLGLLGLGFRARRRNA